MPLPVYNPTRPVLLLDYDGVAHHENVRFSKETGHFWLDAPERYWLFQHVELLDRLLEPHPTIQIVLSTRWVRVKGLRKTAKELTPALRARVVESIVAPDEPVDFWRWSKGAQVAHYVERRRLARWLALDDDPIGWPEWALPHLLLTDPYEGISPPETVQELRRRLAVLADDQQGKP